jgi:hypothetical protein
MLCAGRPPYVLLFDDSKTRLRHWQPELEQRLTTLRLTVHCGAHPRPVEEGIPFLGFIVFPHRRRLKRRKGVQFQRKLRSLIKAWEAGMMSTDTLAAGISGWVNHVRYGNTVGLKKTVLSRVPEEVLQWVSYLD